MTAPTTIDQVDSALRRAREILDTAMLAYERQSSRQATTTPSLSPGVVQLAAGDLLASARSEVMASSGTDALGVDPTSSVLREAEPELLRRGVAVRRLYAPEALDDLDDDAYLEAFVSAGGQARALLGDLPTMLVVDQQVAITRGGDPLSPDYVLLRASPLSRALVTLYEHAWQTAADWVAYRNRLSWAEDQLSTVLFALVEGQKDETAARLLGMSVRTYRRHVAEIMRRLNASSRFQAGVHATRLGLLPAGPHRAHAGRADRTGLRKRNAPASMRSSATPTWPV